MKTVFSNRREAVTVLRQHEPEKIIIATPVASKPAIEQLTDKVNDFACLMKPKSLVAVGFWYENFTQTTDREVYDLLSKVAHKTYPC